MEDTITYIDIEHDIELPAHGGALKASGFEAPGGEFADSSLDLNQLIIKDPTATYFMKMESNDWIRSHILQNDILVVDTSISTYRHLSLVVCAIEGVLTLKRIHHQNNLTFLKTDIETESIEVNKDDSFQIFGIVTGVIRKHEH